MENGLRAAYIHEQIEDKQVTVRYVPGREQRADLLTKSFPKQRLQELTSLCMGISKSCAGSCSVVNDEGDGVVYDGSDFQGPTR